MALQHLYSRVPARLSIYNKTDSFDTFAYSDGLTRDFVEKELAPIYDNKPTKNEAVLIREGKIPPVFCQRSGKNDELIQSCISFVSKDYTGERSSYFVHSLILSDAEKKSSLYSPDYDMLNPEMFCKDFSGIDLNTSEEYPDSNLPELTFLPRQSQNVTEWARRYDTAMLKRLIYAGINLICGKGKPIFLLLSVPHNELSARALEFMNTFVQIIPYHARKSLSFVTDAGDCLKFSGFKIRFLPENAEIVASKGVFLHMGKKMCMGIRDEDVSANLQIVDFFYGLLLNDAVRREFLLYVDGAIRKKPNLAALNLKNLTDLAFLFRQCSGMFPETAVLPNDDRVYDFITVYEKYRDALSDEYRINAMRCLQRYPVNHQMIPKNIFNRICRLYPGETPVTKRQIMNVVLDLIHTDTMRDKLFAFIKNVYEDEDEEIRLLINKDLCSVYYGGFLQLPILAFFAVNFAREPERTRDMVVDKLLLTIRTPAVQPKILEFFNLYYNKLTAAQKDRFYESFLKMLPEADNLAAKLIVLVDEYLPMEQEELKQRIAAGICAAVELDQRRKEPRLLQLLLEKEGFCADAVTAKIFGDWSTKKIFGEYMDALWEKPLEQRIGGILHIWTVVPYMAESVQTKFLAALTELFSTGLAKGSLPSLLQAECTLERETESAKNVQAAAFVRQLAEQALHPIISEASMDVFRQRDGVKMLLEYAQSHPYIKSSDGYKLAYALTAMLKAAEECHCDEILAIWRKLPKDTGVRKDMGKYMKREISSAMTDGEKITSAALLMALTEEMIGGSFQFRNGYDKIHAVLAETEMSDKTGWNADSKAIRILLKGAALICGIPGMDTSVCDPDSGLGQILTDFSSKHGKRGQRWIQDVLAAESGCSEQYRDYCLKTAKNAPGQKGFFAKLFGK